jgi:hypothetical protein
MHDIDRTQVEYSPEMETYEQEHFEYGETGVFSETQAMELAAELLEVSSEAELDRFLGDLIKKAGQAVGQFVKSPVGQQLGGLLKGAAKKALPMVGSAIGGYFGGPSGAQMGSQAASAAGQMFGLELEGLSQEDQEYEAAKSFVQFAGEAVKNATSAPPMANEIPIAQAAAQAFAQAATLAAARKRAPGLLASAPTPTPGGAAGPACPSCGRGASSGRWMRRGTKIVLFGA